MRDQRSASQIQFGMLPDQTVDLQGRVWRVRDWIRPLIESVDSAPLRRELIRAAMPWSTTNMDGGYVSDLYQGRQVRVLTLNKDNGVRVECFPNVWMCKRCRRIPKEGEARCRCGYQAAQPFGQLPFVGYHDRCGALREPWIPRCEQHDDVRIQLPGTASAAEIMFLCPTCNKVLRKGFGFPKCFCGQEGSLSYNVHRASSVFTSHSVVVVNPPLTESVRRLSEAGGGARALDWVLSGMQARSFEDTATSEDALRAQLSSQGLSPAVVDRMVQAAVDAGELGSRDPVFELQAGIRDEAEAEAVTIAMALTKSRIRIAAMRDAAIQSQQNDLVSLYERAYPEAMRRTGVEAVELVEKFPVLTGAFGYTRGRSAPGASRLVPYRDYQGNMAVYASLGETESLLVKLSPTRVARWLEAQGKRLPRWDDDTSARRAILSAAVIPAPGEEPEASSVGERLLTLVHTFAHRLIRRAAVFAGVDRESLSELLVPAHLGFFVYAAARGDFVLGGLQAVFETELDRLLADFIDGDHRCALDPGCRRSGGACAVCVHLGEPSCRYYNRFLDRSALFGNHGFLTAMASTT